MTNGREIPWKCLHEQWQWLQQRMYVYVCIYGFRGRGRVGGQRIESKGLEGFKQRYKTALLRVRRASAHSICTFYLRYQSIDLSMYDRRERVGLASNHVFSRCSRTPEALLKIPAIKYTDHRPDRPISVTKMQASTRARTQAQEKITQIFN